MDLALHAMVPPCEIEAVSCAHINGKHVIFWLIMNLYLHCLNQMLEFFYLLNRLTLWLPLHVRRFKNKFHCVISHLKLSTILPQ